LYESYYRKAQQVRQLVLQDFETAFAQHNIDVLLHPTAPTSAFPLSQKLNPVAMYVNDIMTIPASMAGTPFAAPSHQSLLAHTQACHRTTSHICAYLAAQCTAQATPWSAACGPLSG